MSDYKAAKEAFVAGNPGSSLWRINATSFVALSSYALYTVTASSRRRLSPVVDYALTVLPLLLAITTFSDRPLLLNVLLLLPTGYLLLTPLHPVSGPTASSAPTSLRTSHVRRQEKSAGQWLDESDSDEEPAQPPPPSTHLTPQPHPSTAASASQHTPKLPSEVVYASSSSALSSPSLLSPNERPGLSDRSPSRSPSPRLSKRRHSPTPSTHTHTAIDILPTPPMAANGALQNQARNYPSRGTALPGEGQGGRSKRETFPWLSVYRAHMMIMTVHCILAVDFPVFPRWMGKCEDFGTSLMDVGVGSFVFSLGIVSASSLAPTPTATVPPAITAIVSAVRKSLPVLALGLIRVITVKGSDYPEHVTEYGVHWNFFFTLGLLPVLGIALRPLRHRGIHWSVLGVMVTLLHELVLTRTPLQAFILSPSRPGLLGQNKEGLASLPGYLAIFLLGLSTGEHILRLSSPFQATSKAGVVESPEAHLQRQREKRETELVLELISYGLAWWAGVWVSGLFGVEVSRRLANTPYVFWTAAYNTTFLLAYLVISTRLSSSLPSSLAVPPLLDAINRNGLAVFLVANVLTGLINLGMQTMYMSGWRAMGVLVGYSAGVCWVAWLGRRWRLKI